MNLYLVVMSVPETKEIQVTKFCMISFKSLKLIYFSHFDF